MRISFAMLDLFFCTLPRDRHLYGLTMNLSKQYQPISFKEVFKDMAIKMCDIGFMYRYAPHGSILLRTLHLWL